MEFDAIPIVLFFQPYIKGDNSNSFTEPPFYHIIMHCLKKNEMLLLYFLNSSYNHFDMVTLYFSLCADLNVWKSMYNSLWRLAEKMEDVP